MALAAWLLRLGFVADLLSRPVLIGYMAGVAALMISGQLSKLTGVPVHGEGFVAEVSSFAAHIGLVDWATVALGVVALVFLFVVSWRWPRAPVPLLAVLLGTAAVWFGNLQQHGIKVVGAFTPGRRISDGRRPPDLMLLALPAVGVLLVGYTDFILTARAFETTDSPRSTQTRNCSRSAPPVSRPARSAASRSAAAAVAPRWHGPPARTPRSTRW